MFRFDLSLLSSPSFSSSAKTPNVAKHLQYGQNNSNSRQPKGRILASPLSPLSTRTSATMGTATTDDLTRSTTTSSLQSSAVEVLFLPPPCQQLRRSGPIAGRASNPRVRYTTKLHEAHRNRRGKCMFQPRLPPPPVTSNKAKTTVPVDEIASAWQHPSKPQQEKGERKRRKRRKPRTRGRRKRRTKQKDATKSVVPSSSSPLSSTGLDRSTVGDLLQRMQKNLLSTSLSSHKQPKIVPVPTEYIYKVVVQVERYGIEVTRQPIVSSTTEPNGTQSLNECHSKPRSLFRKQSICDTTLTSSSDRDQDMEFLDDHDEELRILVDKIWMGTVDDNPSTVEDDKRIEFQELPQSIEAEPPSDNIDDCNLMMFVNIEHKVLEYTSDEFHDFD
mmetsp:Transcript_3337/g.8030  ORF Transcript_3337/g.8030 Transcript_3337/m.8030 type:complete len:388 (-) Transcript_3337:991-2154(-)